MLYFNFLITMASGGDENTDRNIDLKRDWEDSDIKFMERMLRATGKFYIIPKYDVEEEEEEEYFEEEEEEYNVNGPQGQIRATSTPVGYENTVPKSFSKEMPSYRVVQPPTPKHSSVRFVDQPHLSSEPHERPPLPTEFKRRYDSPVPMVLSTSNLEEEKSPPKAFGPDFPFHRSRYEELPPPPQSSFRRDTSYLPPPVPLLILKNKLIQETPPHK